MRSVFVLVMVCACGVNPAFDPDGGGGSATSSTGMAPGSEGAGLPTSSSGVVDTTTSGTITGGVIETSGGSTSMIGSTSGATTDASTTTTTGTTTDATDETSAPPASCWDMGIGGWAPGEKIDGLSGAGPSSGWLSPDGLVLYYAGDSPRRPFRVIRVSRDEPFMAGEKLTVWFNLPNFNIDHPAASLGGEELYYQYSTMNGQDTTAGMELQYSTPQMFIPFELYTQPKPVMVMQGAVPDEIPAVSADGTVLIIQRRDGTLLPGFGDTPGYAFHQFTRPGGPGNMWTPVNVASPVNPPLDVALCPALSPDGLHLVYTSTGTGDLNAGNANDVTGIWYTQRGSPMVDWALPQEVPGFAAEEGVPCPRALTADGCTLLYTRFQLGGGGQDYGMFLSER